MSGTPERLAHRNGPVAAPGRRLWVVVVTEPPGEDSVLQELRRALGEHGARRVSADVYLVPDVVGMSTRLAALVDRVRAAGGHVLVADSRVVDPRP